MSYLHVAELVVSNFRALGVDRVQHARHAH